MRWRTKAGDEIAARLGEPLTKDVTAQAWRTALDPKGEWIPAVLAAADKRLTEVRRGVPDAGGARHRHRPDGRPGLRQDPRGDHRREAHRRALRRRRVLGAHRGVRRERPALDGGRADGVRGRRRARGCASGVYATSTSTPLFFAQAVGRFVRARRRGETASVFLPSRARDPRARRPARGRARPRPRPAQDRQTPRPRCGPRRTRCSRRPTAPRRTADIDAAGVRGAGVRRRSSTTCCSTPSSSASTRSVGLRGGAGVPRPARAARARPDGRCCCTSARPPRAPAGPRKADRAGRRRTGPSRRSARSSTSWSPPTPARTAPRTASSTPTCGAPAAGRRWTRRPPSRSSARIETIRRLVRRPPLRPAP